MSLSLLSILLGIAFAIPAIYGLLKPTEFQNSMKTFPRSNNWGYALMAIATAWFLYLVQKEDISDFAAYKNLMIFGFAAIGIGTAIYVRDFLAVRGAALVMLLLAKLMVETARWVDTQWRLVIVVWAYGLVIGGMWFTISPWRMRDLIQWAIKDLGRLKILCLSRIAFCAIVILLGVTIFRTAPQL
jgi:hypothetical protein